MPFSFVPEIASKVKQLDLFSALGGLGPAQAGSALQALGATLFQKVPAWDRLYRYLIYWKNESPRPRFHQFSGLLEYYANMAKREARKQVTDPAKLKKIIPDYKIGCKTDSDFQRLVSGHQPAECEPDYRPY